MKEILKKLFGKDYQSDPPSSIKKKFKGIFPSAVNEEWIEEKNIWEVVFHDDQKEKIVRIDGTGKILERRENTSPKDLPIKILEKVNDKGELMNAILIEKMDGTVWEIIYRNKKLNRYLMVLDTDGKEISSRPL